MATEDKMGATSFEPPYNFIREKLKDGKVIPFLGAGASLCGRESKVRWASPESCFLPNASELAEYLEYLSEFPSGESAELTRVAQYFDGVTGRGGLDSELHKIFARDYQPTALHYHLAEFPTNLLIVTTNYDTLLERAFIERGRPFDLVIYNTSSQTFLLRQHGKQPEKVVPNEFTLQLGKVPVIYKMHGAAHPEDAELDSYVITEDDYVDFLTRMASKTAIPAPLAESFRRSHFLFLGYGLQDWNLRVILHSLWKDWERRYAAWAIQHKASVLEREFWKGRKLTIYEMTIDEFLKKLQQP
jgi:hypothetical protein